MRGPVSLGDAARSRRGTSSAQPSQVIDQRAVVSAVGPVAVATSEHALFSRDAVQLRATWRIGWGVTRPNWIGKFSLAPGS